MRIKFVGRLGTVGQPRRALTASSVGRAQSPLAPAVQTTWGPAGQAHQLRPLRAASISLLSRTQSVCDDRRVFGVCAAPPLPNAPATSAQSSTCQKAGEAGAPACAARTHSHSPQ